MFFGYKFLKDQGYNFQKPPVKAYNNKEKVDEIIHLIDKNDVQ